MSFIRMAIAKIASSETLSSTGFEGLGDHQVSQEKTIGFQKSTISKILVSAGIIIALLAYFDFGFFIKKISTVSYTLFFSTLLLLCLQIILASWRWHIILRSIDTRITLRQSFDNYIAGAVANILFFAAIGGMSVRALLLSRNGTSLNVIAASLVVERLVIVASLLLFLLSGALLFGSQIANHSDEVSTNAILLLFSGLIVAGAAGLLLMKYLQNIELPWLTKFIDNVLILFRSPTQSIALLIGSTIIHIFGFVAVGIIASGLNIELPILFFLFVMPLISFLTKIPIGIGGWGTREMSMVFGLSFLSVSPEDALAISILYGLIGTLSTLLIAAASLTRSMTVKYRS